MRYLAPQFYLSTLVQSMPIARFQFGVALAKFREIWWTDDEADEVTNGRNQR